MNKPLISNGYILDPARLGRLTPSDPAAPIAELREQYAAQGYLWLKGLLEREVVLNFRRRYFEALLTTGLLAPNTDPIDGIYSGSVEDAEQVHRLLLEVVRWEAYTAFCLSEPIVRFYRAFFEDAVYLHRRKLIRHVKPGDPNSTGGHYDMVYLRAGTERFCSSWIPLGDVPVEMGGLVYLEGSDRPGREAEAEVRRASAHLSRDEQLKAFRQSATGWMSKDLPALAERFNSRWLVADYEAGDMLVHSPFIIHAATTNQDSQQRMRLSTDIRFQRASDSIDSRWSQDWRPDDGL
jgi:ectoine hydroxylase-related dioxygenase (phytanoyl-CoA dioxygenase family)